jgi:hypothetical protein
VLPTAHFAQMSVSRVKMPIIGAISLFVPAILRFGLAEVTFIRLIIGFVAGAAFGVVANRISFGAR